MGHVTIAVSLLGAALLTKVHKSNWIRQALEILVGNRSRVLDFSIGNIGEHR